MVPNIETAQSSLLFVGFGYTAENMMPSLTLAGQHVSATVRTERTPAEKAAQYSLFRDLKVQPVRWEGPYPPQTTHLLISTPPNENENDPLLTHLMERPLKSVFPNLRRIGYISTTGVYGDVDGKWVSENSPCLTTQPRSLARIAAERAWMAAAQAEKLEALIFRVSGIYGAKSNILDGIVDKTAKVIIKPGQVFNRIHVEDLAFMLRKCLFSAMVPPGIYNISDDEPCSQEEIYNFAARLLDKSLPPKQLYAEALAKMSPLQASFYAENKRVSNSKIKHATGGLTLQYPTFREGLTALAPNYIDR